MAEDYIKPHYPILIYSLPLLTALSFVHHLGWLLLFRAGWIRDLIRSDLESQGSQLQVGKRAKIHISTWFLWPLSILYGRYVGSERTIKQGSVTEQMSLFFFFTPPLHVLSLSSSDSDLAVAWIWIYTIFPLKKQTKKKQHCASHAQSVLKEQLTKNVHNFLFTANLIVHPRYIVSASFALH